MDFILWLVVQVGKAVCGHWTQLSMHLSLVSLRIGTDLLYKHALFLECWAVDRYRDPVLQQKLDSLLKFLELKYEVTHKQTSCTECSHS